MITKTFTYTYPNEPWNPSVTDGNTVDVTWRGIRYHIFSVDKDGNLFTIESSDDSKDVLDNQLPDHKHDDSTMNGPHTFHILDANDNPEVAAYLLGDDTIPAKDATGGIADYKFTTPGDDENYEYSYNTQNFVQSIHDGSTPVKYNSGTGKFTMPPYLAHPIDKSALFDGYDAEAARIEAAITDKADEFTSDQKTEMQTIATWLKSVRTNYASIDAWKIPHKQISFTWE
tara:strand:- start:7657 stop:8343 length:687 start_codon:yes stop_codon:yes gene_type:complete